MIEKLTPVDKLQGPEAIELKSMYEEAHAFLQSHSWCGDIGEADLGLGIPGIVAVFLIGFKPSKLEVDSKLWVIVGDLPPAYIVLDDSPTPIRALENYVYEMQKWIIAVREGKELSEVIPVNAEPSTENARLLEKRLRFIEKEILHR